jgi:hypothetical protein
VTGEARHYMELIELGGAWINPRHVVSIIPNPGSAAGCTVHLSSGPTVTVAPATAEAVARHLVSTVAATD